MYKILIAIISFMFIANISADYNDFYKRHFDKRNLELSDSYRHIVSSNDISQFIIENSTMEGRKKINPLYLNSNYSKLCYDSYFGEGHLLKKERESITCLKYGILNGLPDSGMYLSDIFWKAKEYRTSAIFLGLSVGLGGNLKVSKMKSDIMKLNNYYKKGLLYSLNLNLKDFKVKNKTIENRFYNIDLDNPLYQNPENKYFITIKQLQLYRFKDMAKHLSERTINASELILLSHVNNEDWKSLVEYCQNYIADYEVKQLCLKQLFNKNKNQNSLLRYALNEKNTFESSKLLKEKEIHFENFYFSLGLGASYKLKEVLKFSNLFLNSIKDSKDFEKAVLSFNLGRASYYNKNKRKLRRN